MAAVSRITTRNARFQQWRALLSHRNKRYRNREFLVHGVRPISVAVERGWSVRALLYSATGRLSRWASDMVRHSSAQCFAVSEELLAELGEKPEARVELVAVVEMPEDDLNRVRVADDFLGVLFDRPTSPGNIGSIIRSADAFGADGVIVTGHAADVYDPQSVRASTGSLFAVPAVRAPSQREVLDWLTRRRAGGRPVTLIGTDERGDGHLFDCDLTGPVLLLIGNETRGLSTSWQEHCDQMVSIPMAGSASSLNAANAATAVLYEAARQRLTSPPGR